MKNDYRSQINCMKDSKGRLDPRIAACAFSASFSEVLAGPGEMIPEPAGSPTRLLEDPDFAEQWARELRASASQEYAGKDSYISLESIVNSHSSVEFANFQGHIINVELTICPAHVGVFYELSADRIFRLFMKSYVEKCSRLGIKAIYYGVAELGAKVGVHFHCGLSVPEEFKSEFQKWLKKSTLSITKGNTSYGDFIYHTFRSPTIRSQWEWWRYSMKRINPRFGYHVNDEFRHYVLYKDAFKIRDRPPVGSMAIKQVRTSESISWISRVRANFNPELPCYSPDAGKWCSDRMYVAGQRAKLAGITSL